MKPVLIALSLFISSQVFAQGFSAGLRTGATNWFSLNAHKEKSVVTKGTFTWNKEAYARYETKRGLAFEFSAMQYIPNQVEWYQAPLCMAGEELLSLNEKYNAAEFMLSVQYRIASDNSTKLKSYLGLSFSQTRVYSTTAVTIRDISTASVRNEVWKYTSGLVYCGVSNFTSYQLTKHINIVSALSFKFDPENIFERSRWDIDEYSPNSNVTWNIGCGYTF
ncbi:hypothetical protein [Polluticoccus soli]|uniref:hypothetical protein n=1 Tax=Polluticoccus soli TaxID=3034150 RepID=UPI0023E28119|nr:hypothetical protein [Flavipsychrobacter sp. JY13-12]